LKNIADLVNYAWHSHRTCLSYDFTVKKSIPILYFGDLEAYSKSQRKIITVGLNPSRQEFPQENPYYRFPLVKTSLSYFDETSFPSFGANEESIQSYLAALNMYFKHKPYEWFNCYEPILQGMNCSYYGEPQENTAIHTDICSPIATDPTWSGLSKTERQSLEVDGIKLWHDLIECVQPDVVIISVAKEHLEKINFQCLSPWQNHEVVARQNPFSIKMRQLKVGLTKSTLVFGQAAQQPFGTVSSVDKKSIGKYIAECLAI